MKTVARLLSILIAICFIALFPRSAWPQSRDAGPRQGEAVKPKLVADYGKLPLSFEVNEGQADSRVHFISHEGGYSLFLTGNEAVLALKAPSGAKNASGSVAGLEFEAPPKEPPRAEILRMRLLGAKAEPRVTGLDELPGKVNYFVGDDASKWHTNVRTYARVKYESVYPGVDLVFYGTNGQLENDFVVAPGADPSAIRLAFGGADKPSISKGGDLLVTVNGAEVELKKPTVYQERNGKRETVSGKYLLNAGEVSFQLANYDRTKPLVIDPVLIYATYLGGNGTDWGTGIAVDPNGNAYVTGYTLGVPGTPPLSDTFPLASPIQSNLYEECAFVSEINAAGTALIYSTFLCDTTPAGSAPATYASGIAVDAAGEAFVVGQTQSGAGGTPHFPTTSGALQPTAPGGTNGFVTKIAAGGSSLVYSTYLGGGDDQALAVAVDAQGDTYVTGSAGSTSFPTFNALQPKLAGVAPNAFVAKINATGSAFVYSTYLGGGGGANPPYSLAGDIGKGIAVDAAGNAYITGVTASPNFPLANALQKEFSGSYEGFVTEINSTGSALVYSTYLGGNGADIGNAIAVDSAGNAYITGTTTTNVNDFPLVNAVQSTANGSSVAFVAEISAGGQSFAYATYLNGTSVESGGNGIAVDSYGDAWVTGVAYSPVYGPCPMMCEFPLVNALAVTLPSPENSRLMGFVAELAPGGSSLVFSTYLGVDSANAIAVDSSGEVCVTGWLSETGFATVGVAQNALGGGQDAFVAKIGSVAGTATVSLSPASLNFPPVDIGSSSQQTVTLTNSGTALLLLYSIGIPAGTAFTETNNCPPALSPTASCTVTATFTPTSSGAQSAALTVVDSAGSQSVSLSSTGAYAAVSLSGGSPAQLPLFTEIWSLPLSNGGPGIAYGVQLTSVTLVPMGTSTDMSSPNFCSATVQTWGPFAAANVAASASTSASVTINFVGCVSKPQFTVTYSWSANQGSVTGTNTMNVQLQ